MKLPLYEGLYRHPAGAVYRESFADLVRRYICGPGAMWDTRTEVPGKDLSRMAKEYDGKELAHQPTFRHTAEHGDDIGLCWFISNTPGDYRLVRHAGGSFGSTSYCAVCPERHTGIVCLANDAGQETEHEVIRLADEIMKELNR